VIVIIDQNGINSYNSPNIEKLFGWVPEELVGRGAWDNAHPDDLASIQQFIGTLMDGGSGTGSTEYRYRCKDGRYKWIEFHGMYLPKDQDIQGILGNYHDITERKITEKELQESEQRFKALHNASFGGITVHDKGLILECNQGLSEITGYSLEELIGMEVLLLIASGSRELVNNRIETGYEKPYEALGIRKNGEEYPLRLESRNIPYKGRRVKTVEFRNISEYKEYEAEQKRLQEQLLQAQKIESVGQLAGGVAHDFNNMLGVILGYTEMAMERIDSSQSIFTELEEIRKAATRSADITRQLLAFARKQNISPKILDLNETVEGMLKMLRRLIGENIDLVWQPETGLWPILMDPSQIDQILANLCVNARDAIDGIGKMIVETENCVLDKEYCGMHAGFVPGEYVRITVSDNGQGMDKKTLAHIFEPFFTTKGVGKGTGLGLATVYGVVKQNNGIIDASSEPGQGTNFSIYLPRYIGKPKQMQASNAIEPSLNGNEIILVVEDEPIILKMTTTMLQQMGYTVHEANTPGEAKYLADELRGEIDLLITDVIMPEMNGRALARHLQRKRPGMKSLFMSGYTADVISHDGMLDDEVYFIQKPFSIKELAAKVREVLNN
jgi:PAS domain S-box-containing protein